MNGQSVLILDVGIGGAYLEHYGEAAPGQPIRLEFRWLSHDIIFDCEVARSTIVRTPGGDGKSVVSHTGVRFIEGRGESESWLHDMMATFVGRVLAAQRANAHGEEKSIDGDSTLHDLGAARRRRSRGFISYLLKGDSWWRVPTDSAAQPENGFTVALHEDEEELETLCRTYEAADEEGRRLIRLVAELSVVIASRG